MVWSVKYGNEEAIPKGENELTLQGFEFRVQGSGLGVWGLGFRCRVGMKKRYRGFRVWGLGFRV